MVYELYFEEHTKTVGLNVLSIINEELKIMNAKLTEINNEKLKMKNSSEVDFSFFTNHLSFDIIHFYEWYQTPQNEVKKRIALIPQRSPNILWVIHRNAT